MSSVIVTIPDDGWIKSGNCIEPDDKMLCVVLHKYGNRTPRIYQYRKADWLYKESDYFLDVSEKWELESTYSDGYWNPSFACWNIIDMWKPLGLPEEENQRILKEIEAWFED